jgi:hypothetical protein
MQLNQNIRNGPTLAVRMEIIVCDLGPAQQVPGRRRLGLRASVVAVSLGPICCMQYIYDTIAERARAKAAFRINLNIRSRLIKHLRLYILNLVYITSIHVRGHARADGGLNTPQPLCSIVGR